MKTHINQVIIVVGFFSLAIISTLTVSWGVNYLLHENKQDNMNLTKIVILKQDKIKSKLYLESTFRLLIPKIK